MLKRVARKCVICALSALLVVSGALAEEPARRHQVVPLTADVLYQGWRADRALGRDVLSNSGDKIGTVRNIVINKSGKIEALIIEDDASEFVFRMLWGKIDMAQFPGKIVADISPGNERQLPLVGTTGESEEFRVTEVIGDYARLQAGLAFGYVSDVVFSSDARMLAVLVVRDAAGGGGIYAFGFPDDTGQWKPAAGYYGLPYVTTDHAKSAAIRVDPKRFRMGKNG